MLDRLQTINRFETLISSVQRKGINDLLDYIRDKTDFYTAPASTKFHLSCEGGLLQHSLNVYDCLIAKKESPVWKEILDEVPDESLKVMALLHDLCKVNFYIKGTRNQKCYDPERVKQAQKWQIKHDDMGDFIWISTYSYEISDQMPLGHGEKSVMLIQHFIKLKTLEIFAIRWHMGFSEPKEVYKAMGEAMEKFPIVLALHEADLEASKIYEGDTGNIKDVPVAAESSDILG